MTSSHLAQLGERSKAASRTLRTAPGAQRIAALELAAAALEAAAGSILSANEADVERARTEGASAAVVDRLRLDAGRIAAMADGMRSVAALADPVGQVVDGYVRPNGLKVQRVRVPLGVVGIVYENRPNVTSDAAALCVKSGNATLLRGSGGAIESNRAIAAAMSTGFEKAGLPLGAVQLVEDTRHETVEEFIRMRGAIDCLIPRGGHS